MCVIADASGVLGLGGLMGGEGSGCSEATTEVFVEAALFDPIRSAQTGRDTGILSDAQYRFARGVDSGFVVPGLELATQLILDLCGGEASDIHVAGTAPAAPEPIAFDPAYVHRLSGLSLGREGVSDILQRLGFTVRSDGAHLQVTPPTWRRDVTGKADLVEEAVRIAGYDQLPSTPLPAVEPTSGGVLTVRQARMRLARRQLAAAGFAETIGWSFVSQAEAELFGGGDVRLKLANPIASDLSDMRPSALSGLIAALGRNAARGFADVALFEIGPVFSGPEPQDQRTAITAVIAPRAPRRWTGAADADAFWIKGRLAALLEEMGVAVDKLQVTQGQTSGWWHPGQSARLQLGPKVVLAEFGALHPSVLKALDTAGPVYAFELWLDAVPEPKRKALKSKGALTLSPFMP
jgi:phenylalanyl-tRNA synthetase beta chain